MLSQRLTGELAPDAALMLLLWVRRVKYGRGYRRGPGAGLTLTRSHDHLHGLQTRKCGIKGQCPPIDRYPTHSKLTLRLLPDIVVRPK